MTLAIANRASVTFVNEDNVSAMIVRSLIVQCSRACRSQLIATDANDGAAGARQNKHARRLTVANS